MNLSSLQSLWPKRVPIPRKNMEKCLCRSVNTTLLTTLCADSQLFLPLQILCSRGCDSDKPVKWPKESAEKWCRERYQTKHSLEPLESMSVLRSPMSATLLCQGYFAYIQQQTWNKHLPFHRAQILYESCLWNMLPVWYLDKLFNLAWLGENQNPWARHQFKGPSPEQALLADWPS